MRVQGAFLLLSGLVLAVYTGIRLGLWARESTAALTDAMGPPGRVEAILLWLAVGCAFGAAIWFMA